MDINRFCIKFYARPGASVDEAVFIEVFHDWIRRRKLAGVLIDVADYRHVPDGPGVMLITHEVNYSMDHTDGRFGLLAERKLGPGDEHTSRIVELVRSTAAFGALLESDRRVRGKLSLEGGGFHYLSNDRLLAPNNEASFAVLQPDLAAAAAIIYPGQSVSISHLDNDPRDRLTVVVEAGRVDMKALLDAVKVAV
jgi:hypothetical protein